MNLKRIKLRPIKEEDAFEIARLHNSNPDLASNLSFFSNGLVSIAEEINWIKATRERMAKKQEFVFVAETIKEGAIVGTTGIHEADICAKSAREGIMVINKNFAGNGYAQEILETLHAWAFDLLKFEKLFMNFRVDNSKMRHIAGKLGYKEAGVLKDAYLLKGGWLDFVRFELTSEDYQKRSKNAR